MNIIEKMHAWLAAATLFIIVTFLFVVVITVTGCVKPPPKIDKVGLYDVEFNKAGGINKVKDEEGRTVYLADFRCPPAGEGAYHLAHPARPIPVDLELAQEEIKLARKALSEVLHVHETCVLKVGR